MRLAPEQAGGSQAMADGRRARLLIRMAVTALALSSSGILTAKTTKPSDELDRFYLNYRPSVRVMYGFSQCMVRRDPSRSSAVALAAYNSEEQGKAVQALVDKNADCLDNIDFMKAQNLFFVGGMAEQLLRLEEGKGPRPTKAVSAFAGGGGTFVWKDKRLKDGDLAELSHVTACLAYTDPDAISALLATGSATENERRQFNSMAPQIKACVPAGRSMSFEPIALRAVLAYAYYVAPRWKDGITVAWLGGGQ